MTDTAPSSVFYVTTFIVRRCTFLPAFSRRLAHRVLKQAALHPNDWNYGNAIHQANLALGEIALRSGDASAACTYLSLAATTPGSPQLNSFGPNMRLALRLLARGERTAVLDYIEGCRAFWKMENGQLDRWKAEVLAGRVPNFGANVWY